MTRFHLVDGIDAWTPGARISGRKLTSSAEDVWEHTGDGPVLPAPLVLEALCQAGTWLVMLSTDHRKRAALLAVDDARFGGEVRPGDVLLLDAEFTSWSDEAAVLDGTVRAVRPDGGATVLTATGILCALIEATDLDDPSATRRMGERLTRGVAADQAVVS
jgi:3-hydroxyacyl-[acyl-carrier-protein] dehydratase